MKKTFLITLVVLLFCTAGYAQNFMVVNSEKVFKASSEYNKAITTIESLTEQHQKKIDAAYESIEKMFSDYQQQKSYLSESTRKAREDAILNKEKEVIKYQEDTFGPEGDLMKKRVELIKPIQDNIFGIINKYATTNKYDLVLDIASDPGILYYAPTSDKTEAIIKLIK